ncbi:hypothetical protein U370_01290 [Anaplasma marginale str. Dawn]|nr:hypothetical protein U128_01300 [Anaplasma marginale str. Gypsy Plains]AGZ80099.1 hypothetical protein U370_01290 [Anaplasma marginale str. Dawn]
MKLRAHAGNRSILHIVEPPYVDGLRQAVMWHLANMYTTLQTIKFGRRTVKSGGDSDCFYDFTRQFYLIF